MKNMICLYFYVNGKFLVHGCSLEQAENYGDCLTYPESHFNIWIKNYEDKYGVEFDWFPRGRVVYRKSTDTFEILYDKCISEQIGEFAKEYYDNDKNVIFNLDDHYVCHMCNPDYI